MNFFDKPAKTKSAADDYAITSPIKAAIKFPKPKILLLDMPDSASTTLRSKGFNVPSLVQSGAQNKIAALPLQLFYSTQIPSSSFLCLAA